jgi:ABC-type lipoprotein export system ATPase subunit
MKSLIQLDEITKTYQMGQVPVPVLRGVSLSIERGEMVVLMGASGSGKSTLMNILGYLDRPTSGEFWLDGDEVSQLDRRELARINNQKIGFCFQQFNLLRRTAAIDNVMMPLAYSATSLNDDECHARAEQLLQRVGLADRMDHMPTQLSGGQQQRVAIARAWHAVGKLPAAFAIHNSLSSDDLRRQIWRRGGRTPIGLLCDGVDAMLQSTTVRVLTLE